MRRQVIASGAQLRGYPWPAVDTGLPDAMKMAAALQLPLTVLTVHQVAASHWTGNPIIYPEDRTAQEEFFRS